MIHEIICIPIRANQNILNSSIPCKINLYESAKPTAFYDLATGYLKLKVRMIGESFDIFQSAKKTKL